MKTAKQAAEQAALDAACEQAEAIADAWLWAAGLAATLLGLWLMWC